MVLVRLIVNTVATLGIDDNNQMVLAIDDDDLPTEEEIIEWTRKSREEGICGIVGCFNKPTTQCKKCTNCYCSVHFPHHLDPLPDGDPNYFSSNEGLDEYMYDSNDFNSDEATDIN